MRYVSVWTRSSFADRGLEVAVQLFDAVDNLGGVGRRGPVEGDRVVFLTRIRCRDDPLSSRPQGALVDRGEKCDALTDRIDGREVLRPEHEVLRRGRGGESRALQEVDLAPAAAHELVADVLGGGDVDDAVALALRAEHREVAAGRVT